MTLVGVARPQWASAPKFTTPMPFSSVDRVGRALLFTGTKDTPFTSDCQFVTPPPASHSTVSGREASSHHESDGDSKMLPRNRSVPPRTTVRPV